MTRHLETELDAASHTSATPRPVGFCGSVWLCGGFLWGTVLWLLEGGLFVSSDAAPSLESFWSGRAALFFYELLGISLALGVGLWWAGVVDRGTTPWAARIRERWTELEVAPSAQRRYVVSRTYAVAIVVPACLWLEYQLARDAPLRIANRDNLGLTLVAVQIAVPALGWAAIRVAERGLLRVFLSANRAGVTSSERCYSPGRHLCVVFAFWLALSSLVVLEFWEPFAELGRRYGVPMVLGALVIASCAKLAPRLRPRPRARRVLVACVLGSWGLSGVSGALVTEALPPVWASAPIARAALGWGDFLLDWDRDGHLAGFGEHDCRPLDGAIHPGALDTPGNAVDEDCDGTDPEPIPSEKPRSSTPAASAQLSVRPNLYLLTVDALATWTLESYGGQRSIAPALDRFAEHAVVFENYFVQGPSTRLSLPALFTSRFDARIDHVLQGRFPFELAPTNHMLAEALSDAGYETCAVIPSPYFSPENWRGLLQGFRHVATKPAEMYAQGTPHTARAVTDAALEFLERPRVRPIFLWAHYFDAHPPHPLPEGQRARGSSTADSYAAEVTHLDSHLGRLIDHIVATDPHHVIVVTSDHGMAFDEPRHRNEHYGYDLSTLVLHVPFMVRAAALAPKRVATLVDALDLAPTITGLAGIARPGTFMGNSLVPLLMGTPTDLPSIRFAQFYLGEEALRGRDPLVMVAARTAAHNLVFDRRAGTLAAWAWREDPEERRDRWPDVRQALTGRQPTMPHWGQARSSAPAGDELAELRALKRALDAHLYEMVAPSSSRSHRSHNETQR